MTTAIRSLKSMYLNSAKISTTQRNLLKQSIFYYTHLLFYIKYQLGLTNYNDH